MADKKCCLILGLMRHVEGEVEASLQFLVEHQFLSEEEAIKAQLNHNMTVRLSKELYELCECDEEVKRLEELFKEETDELFENIKKARVQAGMGMEPEDEEPEQYVMSTEEIPGYW